MHQMNRSTKQYKRKIISGEKGNIKDANKEILKMQTTKFQLGLVPKLIIAIIAGILIGQFLQKVQVMTTYIMKLRTLQLIQPLVELLQK